MKYRKFSDLGWNVSEIELGCWGIGGNWDDVKDDEAKNDARHHKNIPKSQFYHFFACWDIFQKKDDYQNPFFF